jgi:hypothetical protein
VGVLDADREQFVRALADHLPRGRTPPPHGGP